MRKAEAQRQIERAFEDLVALVDHLTILDMAAAFAVGEARKTLWGKYRNSARARLVRETDDFQGLSDITRLIDADLDDQVKGRLESVRENRKIHNSLDS